MIILDNFFSYFSKKREHGLKTIYAALLFMSLHWSLIAFVDSSYLQQFLSDGHISLLFTASSCLLLIPFIYMSSFLRKVGNFRLTIFFSIIEVLALFGMAYASSAFFAIFFFIIHFVIGPLMFFNLDIFTEAVIGSQEKQTGTARGMYLVLYSFAGAIAPLASGYLIDDANIASFTLVYIVSALLLLPFIWIVTLYFKEFADPTYPKTNVRSLVATFTREKDTRNVFIAQFHLQFFFTWMVIYTPLYLASVVGFNWTEIGYILFAGLMAYVILEYPIGLIADKYIGEKEMMAFGFFLIAVSTSWIAFLPPNNIGMWMFVMFLTRAGASFVEATTESYFFKHTRSADSDKISLFRSARPLASILAALLGSYILIQVEFSFTFIILGFLMLPGIFFTLLLKDTK